MKFTLDYLKSLGRKPRVHPNGFVQLDVEPTIMRLNVWPEKPIPGHPGRVHPIHNHSFDINSTIIYGALTNDTYMFRYTEHAPSVTHILHEAKRINEFDSVLTPIPERFAGYLVKDYGSRTYEVGQRYILGRDILHDSIPNGLTATLMTLERASKVYAPQVAVPVGVEPRNDYRRDVFDEDMLWEIIGQVL